MAEFNKTMEFMMMKRLHFLRNSLDTHNPHETTLRMRDNALKKRDERILELWRPPIFDIRHIACRIQGINIRDV